MGVMLFMLLVAMVPTGGSLEPGDYAIGYFECTAYDDLWTFRFPGTVFIYVAPWPWREELWRSGSFARTFIPTWPISYFKSGMTAGVLMISHPTYLFSLAPNFRILLNKLVLTKQRMNRDNRRVTKLVMVYW